MVTHPDPPANDLDARAAVLLDAQSRVLELIVRGAELREILDALCRIVETQAAQPVRCAIMLVDAAGTGLYTAAAPSIAEVYTSAIDGVRIDPQLGTCSAAAARGEVVVTPDIANDPSWSELRQLPLAQGFVAAYSQPILASTGRALGTFGTYFLERRVPSAHERQLSEVLARTAALAIERRQADQALRASEGRHRFLVELATATQPLADVNEIMIRTAQLLAEHLGADRCAYAEIEDERIFDITGDWSRGGPSIVGRWPVASFGPKCLSQMLAGEPFVVHDVASEPEVTAEFARAYEAIRIRAVVCVPLHKRGKFTAAMAVHQFVPRHWTDAEIELITTVVSRCWEALERARVTHTLLQSEERYRTMVEASPESVALVGADGRLLQMNHAARRMLELSEDDNLIGHSAYDVIAPEHRARFQQFNEWVCGGHRGTLEFEIVGRSGTRRYVETTAVPLPAAGGGYMRLGMTRDITARVLADRALRESRARLEYAVRLSGVGFWYCDLPFDVLEWDARVKEHFFLPPDARVTIDLFYEIIHPEDRAHTRLAIEASIQDHSSYDVVYRTVNADSGSIKWVRALGGTKYSADGRPERFDGVTVDVTAQRLDQERLADMLEREREQGRALEKVALAALNIHAADTLDGVLSVVTEQARQIVGAQRALTTLELLDAMQPEAGRVHHERLAVSPLAVTRVQPTELLAVPLVGRHGAKLGVVQLSDKLHGEFSDSDEAILTQLAHIAAVAIENVQLYDQLREQDRRKDEFLATLAHELRNPLAPIRTGLGIWRMASDPAQANKAREMMERQLGHMVRMVDDLLDISRITLGKVELRRERLDFRVAVYSALETTLPLVQAGGHELDVRLPTVPLPLDADPTRLAQIVANLVNNAAKYTPPGGRISLHADSDGQFLSLHVTDTGVGIAAEMLPRVFDMFTQLGRTLDRAQGGLGIGLTLVRRLVELHGGSVEATSPGPGRGSRFTVRLPLAAAIELPPMAAASVSGRESESGAPGALRVLVVDDNIDGAESLAMLLDMHGHVTRMEHSGPSALTAVMEFVPHVIFLDIGLPELDGYEVAKRIRADSSQPQPFLVALTGWGSDADRRRAQDAGFDRHLVKPLDTTKISAILSAIQR